MIENVKGTVTLHNGVKMPGFGLGVYKSEDGKEVINSIKNAVEAGYRLIDTAAFYNNEIGVGQAIKEVQVPREELFVTTKVWNTDQGYEQTLAAFETSLQKLNLDYIDLYLIHWPVPGKYIDTWRALEKLYREGKVKAIGVSNFQIHHIEDLIRECEIVPMVNQVELHPLLSQKELREYCASKNIMVEAWSPIARGRLFDHPTLIEIAAKYRKSIAQIILRWDIQHGIITIPKSVKKERIIENASIFQFELDSDDMKKIDELNENKRFGQDPDNLNL